MMFKKKTTKNLQKPKISRNHYSYWQALGLSFYSPNIYVDAAKRWTGLGAMYLLFLCFILASPIAAQFIQKTRHFFNDTLEPAVKEMPTLIIKDKKLSFKEDKSRGITPQTKSWVWPPHKSINQSYPDIVINLPRNLQTFQTVFIPILITQNFIQIQNYSPIGKDVITDVIEIGKDEDGVFGPEELGQMITQIKYNLLSSAYSYLAFFMWAMLFSSLLFTANIANVLYYAIYRTKLSWRNAVRVLSIAVTPGLVLLEILYFLDQINYKWLLFSLAVIVGYYFLGARACILDREPVLR